MSPLGVIKMFKDLYPKRVPLVLMARKKKPKNTQTILASSQGGAVWRCSGDYSSSEGDSD